jgi:hypothetical protein
LQRSVLLIGVLFSCLLKGASGPSLTAKNLNFDLIKG